MAFGCQRKRASGHPHRLVCFPRSCAVPRLFAPPTPEQRGGLRNRYSLPENEVVVAYVGRLVEDKGVRDLLEALGRPEAHRPFLTIWGSGPLAGLVEGVLGTGEVRGRFGGALDRGAVADALRELSTSSPSLTGTHRNIPRTVRPGDR